MTIVDSTVWVDYFRGRTTAETTWLDRNVALQAIGLTDLILCEVLQGVRDESLLPRLRRDLAAFHIFDTGGVALAVAAASHDRKLRARGRTIKTIDCLIATFCIVNGHALLHCDHDYDVFERELNLAVVHPDAH